MMIVAQWMLDRRVQDSAVAKRRGRSQLGPRLAVMEYRIAIAVGCTIVYDSTIMDEIGQSSFLRCLPLPSMQIEGEAKGGP